MLNRDVPRQTHSSDLQLDSLLVPVRCPTVEAANGAKTESRETVTELKGRAGCIDFQPQKLTGAMGMGAIRVDA